MLGFALTAAPGTTFVACFPSRSRTVPGVFRLDDATSWTAPPAVGNKFNHCNFINAT